MALISFSGLGGQLDFGQITDAIVTQRRIPVVQLQGKSAEYGARASSLKELNGLLITLKSAAAALAAPNLGTARMASSDDSSVATARADSSATTGTFRLNVSRLATALAQKSRSFSAEDEAVLAGGATSATFELRKGGASEGVSITIDEENNTLEGLRDAINAADAGLSASVVDVSGAGDFRLVLNSKETGAAGRVELVETTQTGTLAGLGLTRLNPPADPSDFSNLDAEFSVGGLVVTRPTNTVTDAVTGLSFELKKQGAAAINVSQAPDVGPKLQSFVAAYNAVQDFILRQYKPDAEGRPSGILAGEPTLRTVQHQLRAAVGESDASNGGALRSLAEVGVGRDDQGRLTLDTATLNGMLSSSFDGVRALFSGLTDEHAGIADRFEDVLSRLSDDIDGTVQAAISGYEDTAERLSDSAARQLDAIERLKESLTRQFAAMDAALSQLNSQSTALTAIIDSMKPKENG